MINNFLEISEWFSRNHRELYRNGLGLLGGEPNTLLPETWDQSSLRILIARLSPYFEVTQGITHSYLFQLCKTVKGVFVDLAYFPTSHDEKIMRKSGIPLLTGTTTKRPASDFDIIAISNSVLQELINFPAFLEGSGIELSQIRRQEKNQPFILLGGSNAYCTSILHGPISSDISETGLVDGVIIGDGDYALPQFLNSFIQAQNIPMKQKLLRFANEVPGFYAPSFYHQRFDDHGKLISISTIENSPFPVKAARKPQNDNLIFECGPIFYDENTAGISHLLLSNGCPFFCSFCKESWEQKPYRENHFEALIEKSSLLKANLGLHEVNLMTFNANTFSKLDQVLYSLERNYFRVSMKSQRFDAIAKSPAILDREIASGKKTFTCAMEGISQKIRCYLNKNLDENTILDSFKILFSKSIRQMKVFVIISGLEDISDFEEFSSFLSKLKVILNNFRGKPIITFSLSGLFQPPFTPLQFAPFSHNYPKILETIFNKSIDIIKKNGFEARISAGPWDAALSRLIAFADRRSTPILVEASLNKGFRYFGEIEKPLFEFWNEAIKNKNLFSTFHAKQFSEETVFPWDDITIGIPKKFLFESYKKVSELKEIKPCISSPLGTSSCVGCQACPDTFNRIFLNKLSPPSFLKSAMGAGNQGKPLLYRLEANIPPKWAFTGNNFLFAALARMIMLGKPSWVPFFLKFEDGIERNGTSGFFSCDFTIKKMAERIEPEKDIPEMNKHGQGLEIRKIYAAKESIKDLHPQLLMKIASPNPPDRRIDITLGKYKIKHQKRWIKDTLIWEIASGYAKKEGFSQIKWTKDSLFFSIEICANPTPQIMENLCDGETRELQIIDWRK
ncbi:MAG: hypothetical protein HQM08_13125 [Candidatus Riflebacteria bacterium]|nr:hypothetical protein [Candidatus Riflebacteria bacterium]